MFSSLLDAARNSPFKAPGKIVRCEESNGENSQLVPTRTIQAANALPGDSCEFGSLHYFALCGVGGILSCGTTHTFVVPLDLVKCRLQVNQAKYKNLFNGFRLTVSHKLLKIDILLIKVLIGCWRRITWIIERMGTNILRLFSSSKCIPFTWLQYFRTFYLINDNQAQRHQYFITFFLLLLRVSSNSASMRSSRSTMQNYWARRMLMFIVLVSSLLPLLQLNSSLILHWLHSKLQRLRFRHQKTLQAQCVLPCPRCMLMREFPLSIRD